MASSATVSASSAVCKTLYPKGELPVANYKQNVLHAMMPKQEDFEGVNKVVAVQTEWPQGIGSDFQSALLSLAQGTYSAFTVTRSKYYGIARVQGEALKAVVKDYGGLVDLWKNEIDGASKNVTRQLGIFGYKSGTGSLSAIASSSTVASATITVSPTSAAVFYAVGMTLQAVGSDGGTLRGGGASAVVSGVDMDAGTITTAGGNWSTQIPGLTASTDFLLRVGDNNNVITGLGGWIVGGASPGTLFSLNRNTNPVKLSGQSHNATTQPYSDALQSMVGKVAGKGGEAGEYFMCHPTDLANWLKQIDGKVMYQQNPVPTKVAGLSFEGVQFQGRNGKINVLQDINCPLNTGWLVNLDNFKLHSLGPAPQILDFDSNQFLRVSNDDAYEVRVGMYGNMWCNNPLNQIKATNFGA